MRRVAAIVLGALMLSGAASASRPVADAELRWMIDGNINTGNGSFGEWGRVSTIDAHYGVVYAKRCGGAVRCETHTQPLYAYLLRRPRLTLRGWVESLQAQAQLRPPKGVTRLCRGAPRAVRHDLLATICKG
jgi:hypothetical protein